MLKRVQIRVLFAGVLVLSLLPFSHAEAKLPSHGGDPVRQDSKGSVVITAGGVEKGELGPARRKSSARVCLDGDEEVPCVTEHGVWQDREGCWAKALSQQPPRNDPRWKGAATGIMGKCTFQRVFNRASQHLEIDLILEDPNAPSARDLAYQAIEYLQLEPPKISMSPIPTERDPESMAIVGSPVWLWVENPGEHTYGPITRAATAGPYSVTATARVDKITWDMGEGKPVVCRNPGTKRQKWHGDEKSPTCGHTYQKQGSYQIKATAHWVIRWAGMGQSGTLTTELSTTTSTLVGEIQVVNVNPEKKASS